MTSLSTKEVTEKLVDDLLDEIEALVKEVHPHHKLQEPVTLDSSFDKKLGLDSLARIELISRVEKRFKLILPERTFTEAETARDLLRVLAGASRRSVETSQFNIRFGKLGVASAAPNEAQTLIEVLNWHVLNHPGRPHIQIYQDEGKGEVINYRQLKNRAESVAAGLQQRGITQGEAVAIMLPSSPDYFYSFFGILFAGGIPVPIYPPARPSQLEDHMRRHVGILSNCLATILITLPEAKRVAQLLKSQVSNLAHIVTVYDLDSENTELVPLSINAQDIAFLQYTSGSTGSPKGVVLTHENLLANIRAMGQVVNASPQDVFVSWLPLYHDMGLIGAWLGSLYFAALFVNMSPMSFLVRPERWLWAIHHYHGTLSASPNFGFEFCLKRLKGDELKNLNLSSWRCAFNGAEPVSPDTLENFTDFYSKYGFSPESMMPVYGLAESSVGLAFPPVNRGIVLDAIERETFMRSAHAIPTKFEDSRALRFVSSGPPLPGHEIRVIDQAGHELPERVEGRLQFKGPSCTSGYYRNPEKNQTLFYDEWLDSGDLAYIANGEVYITGRTKDIIIRAGRNIYPHELEMAVGNITGIRAGRVVIFGSEDKKTGTERLIIMAETRVHDSTKLQELHDDINSLATDLIGAPPDEIVLAPPNSVLKTSSGKLRRAASREMYEQGKLGKAQASVPLQIVRLSISSILPQIKRSLRYLKTVAFAVYSWSVFYLLAPIVWFATAFLPSMKWRWAIMRGCTNLLAKATATTITVNGVENIPQDGKPYVIVANHSSYLDSYALVSKLPAIFSFVAKAELAQSFTTRKPLIGINTVFVERSDIDKSTQEIQHLTNMLKNGQPLLFYAEGTFTRIPGLMPFHLGAFVVAEQAGVPVIPVAIRGTRSILRSESRFPHHGAIHIEVGSAIMPKETINEENQWRVAIDLRDRSRDFIKRHCGEPDLV